MIPIIQNVLYEYPGYIADWLVAKDEPHGVIRIFEDEVLPDSEAIKGLVILGGPMNVEDEEKLPWLKTEKAYIRKVIHSGKKVLGICLGAQLIAEALGASVTFNPGPEIGWFPVHVLKDDLPEPYKRALPQSFTTFHSHFQGFEIPVGAVRLAYSEASENQGFIFGNNVLALQFHPEMTPGGIEDLLTHSSHEKVRDIRSVQSPATIRSGMENTDLNKKILFSLLEAFFIQSNEQ
jgi:GMP synthase-like glutamine amidotransferase